jgi:aerobic carbon-monoxide dehydrogenase medium subunit
MKPASFTYHAPACFDEAVVLLANGPQDGRILAGGQSLVATMALRMARPEHVIDINGIAEQARMSVIDGVLRIGACERHAAFDSGAPPGAAGARCATWCAISRSPIRTRGTFCDSVANANPASEWCCVMAALGGAAVRTIRRLHAHEFFQGIMTTALKEDELIVAAELPLLADDTRTRFEEFSHCKGDFAIALAPVSYRLDRAVMVEPRFAISGASACRGV